MGGPTFTLYLCRYKCDNGLSGDEGSGVSAHGGEGEDAHSEDAEVPDGEF